MSKTIREILEENEKLILSPYATLSVNSKGRELPDEECTMRTCFQKDRDRILHCNTWLREKDKTQVITPSLCTNSDHYRTRMTHSLEVSQIGRTIAKALGLNEDLVEAAALGHDLGHTPFGHAGESVLNERYEFGFTHTTHSIRVVEHLEKHGAGLNLTFEVKDAILNHSGLSNNPQAATLEGRILPFADKIAYLTSDLEDAVKYGMITYGDVPNDIKTILGSTKNEIITTLVTSIVNASIGHNHIKMEDNIYDAMANLRNWMFKNVYKSEAMQEQRKNISKIVNTICDYYEEYPNKMLDISTPNDVKRSVCDYVASMTDSYAMNVYKEIVGIVWC
jgi:dGTPase